MEMKRSNSERLRIYGQTSGVQRQSQSTVVKNHKHSSSESFPSIAYPNIPQRSQKSEHEYTQNARPFNCDYCEKTFIFRSKKVEHERIHNGDKPFSCAFCLKTFSRMHNKVAHERIHSGDKPFHCTFCLKTFSQMQFKVRHERIHSGERPFHCTFCLKTFREMHHKVAHERIHSGELPFSCDYCEKTFNQKSNKLSHEKRIHSLKSTSSSACNVGVCTTTESEGNNSSCVAPVSVTESSTESLRKNRMCSVCLKMYLEESEEEALKRSWPGLENEEKPSLCGKCYEVLFM